jgi:UDP-N-acetylmuramoyl-L-alanyl-D-glutamate--2,6-diaminopimelate ligase
MREAKVNSVAIEVSAQALTQHRIDGIHFDVVGFTNLSHDHLDDYADMGEYLVAKAGLFQPNRAKRGVVCLDSEYGAQFAALAKIPYVTVATGKPADFTVTVTEEVPARTSFSVTTTNGEVIESWLPIIGAHMASNAGLAIAMLIEAGFAVDRIRESVAGGIHAYLPGRTERVTGETGPDVYVDFGHSPDAFLNTLRAVRKVTRGKVIMLFGADGDRDASKRPAMAKVSAENCDVLVITDHHPRFEDPASIREVLVEAARDAKPELPVFDISPPEEAIRLAVSMAGVGDAVLWAGPGHQDYRDIRGVRTPYSARALARAALKEFGWS